MESSRGICGGSGFANVSSSTHLLRFSTLRLFRIRIYGTMVGVSLFTFSVKMLGPGLGGGQVISGAMVFCLPCFSSWCKGSLLPNERDAFI